MSADGLTGFDQFSFRRGLLFQFVTPEDEIEEPDNKTIGEQQQYWSENRPVENQAVPDVSHFQRDQCAGSLIRQLFAELYHSATIGFSRQQISSLLPSGSSKKKP